MSLLLCLSKRCLLLLKQKVLSISGSGLSGKGLCIKRKKTYKFSKNTTKENQKLKRKKCLVNLQLFISMVTNWSLTIAPKT